MNDVWIVPPNYIGQLCDCKYACLMSRNRVRLVHLDDTKTEAIIPESERIGWANASERGNWPNSFFDLVSVVQSKQQQAKQEQTK
jgi:hypothetical protein